VFKDGTLPMNITGWNEPMALRGLSGSVPSDSTFASYHKAPGSEREYAQVKAYFGCYLFVFIFVNDVLFSSAYNSLLES